MASVGAVMSQRRRTTSSEILQFPEDLGPHSMLLTFKKYEYIRPGERFLNTAGTLATETVSIGDSIILPLPTQIMDNYSVENRPTSMGFTGDLVASAAAAMGSSDIQTEVKNLMQSVIPGFSAAGYDTAQFATDASFLGRRTIDALIPNAGNNIDIGLGNMLNPKMALFFDGVNLRNHNFDWRFAPASENETDILKKIQNIIRRNILPTYGEIAGVNKTLLNYPSVCNIYFFGVDQSYFLYYKTCMVKEFSINFTPNGLALLPGGRPAAVEMNMQLSEMDIHTSEDYGGVSTFETITDPNGGDRR